MKYLKYGPWMAYVGIFVVWQLLTTLLTIMRAVGL
jgi:hypothetical protein